MLVDFLTIRGVVVDYSVVLVCIGGAEGVVTIRAYDGVHGFNEMHRHTRSAGKQDGVVFSRATLGEGMRAAMKDIKTRYLSMIEGWER